MDEWREKILKNEYKTKNNELQIGSTSFSIKNLEYSPEGVKTKKSISISLNYYDLATLVIDEKKGTLTITEK
jgi:hypothetical protein